MGEELRYIRQYKFTCDTCSFNSINTDNQHLLRYFKGHIKRPANMDERVQCTGSISENVIKEKLIEIYVVYSWGRLYHLINEEVGYLTICGKKSIYTNPKHPKGSRTPITVKGTPPKELEACSKCVQAWTLYGDRFHPSGSTKEHKAISQLYQ